MHRFRKLALGAGAVLGAVALLAPAAGASGLHRGPHGGWGGHAVFVQTDATSGNQVVAYDRSWNGTLTQAGTYATGGLGGIQNGSAADHLASQGSLALDPWHQLLFAVNAGSNSVSVFRVFGDSLVLRQVIGSGGTFPSSVAVFGDLVYVLNAQDGGSLQGYRIVGDGLFPLPGSARALGLVTPTDTTQFTHTPGQVAFSPTGRQLLVTTKATTSAVDVYAVWPDGRLSASPTVNVEAGAVPFAVTFDRFGRLLVANAGSDSVSSYWLLGNGTLVPLVTTPTGEVATCWITQARGFVYLSNAGSANLSELAPAGGGAFTTLGTASTDPGTVDATATPDGQYLYVQTGINGIVDEFSVGSTGTLSALGSVTVPGAAGGEGIAAS